MSPSPRIVIRNTTTLHPSMQSGHHPRCLTRQRSRYFTLHSRSWRSIGRDLLALLRSAQRQRRRGRLVLARRMSKSEVAAGRRIIGNVRAVPFRNLCRTRTKPMTARQTPLTRISPRQECLSLQPTFERRCPSKRIRARDQRTILSRQWSCRFPATTGARKLR